MSKPPLKMPYVVWREGRPRFVPGASARGLGFKGRDLRHENGQWFTLEEAFAFSQDTRRDLEAARAGLAGRTPLKAPPVRHSGSQQTFVYFLRCGDWVKIGFSNDPTRRMREIAAKVPYAITSMAVVPGSRHDEARVHLALERFRLKGEWYVYRSEVTTIIVRSLSFGRVMIGEDARETRTKSETMSHAPLPT